MGSMCTGSIPLDSLPPARRTIRLNSKYDLQFQAGQFVQENHESFFSIYTLQSPPIGSGAYAKV